MSVKDPGSEVLLRRLEDLEQLLAEAHHMHAPSLGESAWAAALRAWPADTCSGRMPRERTPLTTSAINPPTALRQANSSLSGYSRHPVHRCPTQNPCTA